MKPRLVVGVLALLLFSLLPLPVWGTTGTLTITTDTSLTEDHTGNIIIAADGVTLDGAGHTVTSPTPYSGTGILLDGRTGVTVKNLHVTHFSRGFILSSSDGNTLTGNMAYDNDIGFSLSSSSDNTLEANTANGSVIADGFRLLDSDGNTLTGNTAYGNSYGFFLGNSIYNTLEANTANGNYQGFLAEESVGNTLTGNTAYGNSYGFRFYLSSGNTLYHNNIIDNWVQAFDLDPFDPFGLGYTANDWHHPDLLEGNYWSDYPGVDDGSGTGKHAIAGDNIGDTDIPWPGPDYDNYPFVIESGWEVITVMIDIKPGSDPNSINLKSKGLISVAVFTTNDFDATTIDVTTVRFGRNGDEASETHNKLHLEDVDGDGDLDAVFHFRTGDTGIQPGDTSATITGMDTSGRSFTGTDTIRTVG